jgi:hypothetical protein
MTKVALLPKSDCASLEVNLCGNSQRTEAIEQIIDRIWRNFVLNCSEYRNFRTIRGEENIACIYPRRPFIEKDLMECLDGCIFDLDAYNENDKHLIQELPLIPQKLYAGYVSSNGSRLNQIGSSLRLDLFPHPLENEGKILLYLRRLLSRICERESEAYRNIIIELEIMHKLYYSGKEMN